MMLEDIGQYLQKKGLGTLGKDIFLGMLPSAPDSCVALFEYQGQMANQLAGLQTPGLQVVCRAKNNYPQARGKLQAIYDVLSRVGFEEDEQDAPGIVMNGSQYFRIAPALSGIVPLGVDETGRVRIAQNFYVTSSDGA